jgi:hypothetical protein
MEFKMKNRMRWGVVAGGLVLVLMAGQLGALEDRGEVEKNPAVDSLRMTLDLQQFNDNPRKVRVQIWNHAKKDMRVQHPADRQAVVFFVTDNLGNVVMPVGRAKVDPPPRELVIKSGEHYTHEMGDLEFLTGSALFGFDLRPQSEYRVIAVYRPEKNLPGIASAEKSITTR